VNGKEGREHAENDRKEKRLHNPYRAACLPCFFLM
jgi:hypothetical protein